MAEEHLKILIAEDEEAHVEAISRAFRAAGKSVDIRSAGTLLEYRLLAEEFRPDIALLDLNLPDGKALEILTYPPEEGGFPSIIMTAYGNEQMAVEALKAGALDYVVKSPEAFAVMPRSVERALREWNLLQEHRRAEKMQQASLRFLKIMHKHTEIRPLLEELVAGIKDYTGCDSVAIRVLDEAGNIPYLAYEGFSTKFVEMESPLSVKSDNCMCVNVIMGITNPQLPFYTAGGSFYMNATTRFLATVPVDEKGETRNICNQEGYESVALVPFRSGGRILGLIHVADHRENMVPVKMVEQLEGVAMQLGTAIQKASAEYALRESEERYRTLFESSLDAVLLSIPDGRILSANPSACLMFGRTEEEMCALGRDRLVDMSDPRLTKLIEERARNGKAAGELTFVRKDGSRFTGEISSVLFINAAGILRSSVIIRDTTDRKHLEAQLLRAQKMEAVGTLAGGIAHDFNNILNVILGYGNMVLDSLEADSPARGRMNEVLDAAERAAVLTKRLLVFSRKQVFAVNPVNVNEIVIGIQAMLNRIIGEDIDFKLDITESPVIVMADAGQIEQVLMNLVSNARDAMPEGGRLTIGAGIQEIDDEYVSMNGYGKPGMYALITVADTGKGMDAETQKRIFEPFFTTKGIGEGTGLGLAISYGIVKQHNGYLKVYSEPEQGTLFKIFLPLSKDTALPDRETESFNVVKGGTETVLVAEDDEFLRKLSRIVLESFGYSVITADDGEAAIAKFMENRESIDLVIIDMIMPKKNGKEVSEALRKASPRTKILFVSGYTMDMINNRELTENGFDFIHKPVRPQDLLKKVREVLDR